jgi:rubrerythrin
MKVSGPQEMNLQWLSGDESPENIIAIACGMENGLGQFYEKAIEKTADPSIIDLLSRLAEYEDKHQKALLSLHSELVSSPNDTAALESNIFSDRMEGGFDVDNFLKANAHSLQHTEDLFYLAMMLETQAMDFYRRFADKSTRADAKQMLFKLASEEKKHLVELGRMFDRKL